jgi:hypothetical protein
MWNQQPMNVNSVPWENFVHQVCLWQQTLSPRQGGQFFVVPSSLRLRGCYQVFAWKCCCGCCWTLNVTIRTHSFQKSIPPCPWSCSLDHLCFFQRYAVIEEERYWTSRISAVVAIVLPEPRSRVRLSYREEYVHPLTAWKSLWREYFIP